MFQFKNENDYLTLMQVVVLKMEADKVPLKKISFTTIIKVLVKEGQILSTNWSNVKDKAWNMKSKIKRMVQEWNLTYKVDRHCSQENKEMFEFYIERIATLEKQFDCDKKKTSTKETHLSSMEILEDKEEETGNTLQQDTVLNIRNSLEEESCDERVQETNIKAEEKSKSQRAVFSRMKPENEKDFLILIQAVVLKMNEDKVPLENLSFRSILQSLVNEGQMEVTSWTSVRDKSCRMKSRIKQMVTDWNLTNTLDSYWHCSPENKEMFELYIADIATLEKQLICE